LQSSGAQRLFYHPVYINAKLLQFMELEIPPIVIFTRSAGEQDQKTVVALCPGMDTPALKTAFGTMQLKALKISLIKSTINQARTFSDSCLI
jgi:hypothetical protein